jgi:hypothetical protein
MLPRRFKQQRATKHALGGLHDQNLEYLLGRVNTSALCGSLVNSKYMNMCNYELSSLKKKEAEP